MTNSINPSDVKVGDDGKLYTAPHANITPVTKYFLTKEDGSLEEFMIDDPKNIVSPPSSVEATKENTPPLKRIGTDWKSQFRPEEMVKKKSGECVRLRGLQRCALLCGLLESYPEMKYIERQNKPGIMQCVYHVIFDDGSHFAGAADVNDLNVDDVFKKFPTSVAESRAEARALRKALGITDMLAAEEIDGTEDGGSTGQKDMALGDKAEKQQITAIQSLCEQLKKEILDVLNEVLGVERAKGIYAIDQITSGEAIKILSWLNDKRADLPVQPPVNTSKKIDINKKKE